METHDDDPRSDADTDPWEQASDQFSSLGSKLRDRYNELVGDAGPDETDVKDALKTIGNAAQSVVDSLNESMRDPAVRQQLKDATSSFFSAIGKTLSQLGDELKDVESDDADDRAE